MRSGRACLVVGPLPDLVPAVAGVLAAQGGHAGGAHLLLQVRPRVLNDQLAGDFRRWYPGFNQAPDPVTLAA